MQTVRIEVNVHGRLDADDVIAAVEQALKLFTEQNPVGTKDLGQMWEVLRDKYGSHPIGFMEIK